MKTKIHKDDLKINKDANRYNSRNSGKDKITKKEKEELVEDKKHKRTRLNENQKERKRPSETVA